MTDLPPELEDLIIDHLHDQKHALTTCGLVNKAWLRSSRQHLFEVVTLRDTTICKAFARLSTSPLATFAHCVNALVISPPDHGTLKFLTAFIPKMPDLPAMRRLHFTDIDRGLDKAVADSIATKFDNITDVDFTAVRFDTPQQMIAFLSCFTRLKKVSIVVDFVQDGDPVSYPVIPHTLEDLRLRLGPGNVNPFPPIIASLHGGAPPRIRVLNLARVGAKILPSVGKLLHTLGAGLEALDLLLMPDVAADDIKTHINLSQHIRLQRLAIHINLRVGHDTAASQQAGWALLDTTRSAIATLTIALTINDFECLDNFDWECLNAILQMPQFTALRRVHFIVDSFGLVTRTAQWAIRARIHKYDARWILDVSWK
ncbi:hypothetical protein B0H19DRAFT_1087988 [Mycena capillaripes]|nr:hypothetical protein B0H19DRAFT_1087988 [Mycena capillaripes]